MGVLSSFFDWAKKRGQKTKAMSKDATAGLDSDLSLPPSVPMDLDLHVHKGGPTIPQSGMPTMVLPANAGTMHPKTVRNLQQVMQNLGPQDKMTTTAKGYFVTTKPGSPPVKNLPRDVFGPYEEDPKESFKGWLEAKGWGDGWGQMMHDREQSKFPKPGTPGTSSNQINVKDADKVLNADGSPKNPKSDLNKRKP